MNFKLEVNKDDWKKLALAVGDKNPIHYLENNAICPGVYLFAQVEKMARSDGRFDLPSIIRANFIDYVSEGESLILNTDYSENNSIFNYYKDKEKISGFEIEKVYDRESSYSHYYFNGDFVDVRKIFEDDLKSFNESLNNNVNKVVYSIFGVGRALENFLTGREGALLKELEFCCYRELELGELSVKLKIEEETRKRGRKEITDYIIRGEIIQSNELVSIGYGKAQRKLIRNNFNT